MYLTSIACKVPHYINSQKNEQNEQQNEIKFKLTSRDHFLHSLSFVHIVLLSQLKIHQADHLSHYTWAGSNCK